MKFSRSMLAIITLLASAMPAMAGESLASADLIAEEEANRENARGLDQRVQGLKKEVLDLNRDLFLLEEDLLFPANTQVAFFVSMDVGEFFALDSVTLIIDGKEVSNYLYTAREVDALMRGGVHRLHTANLKAGEHELVAVFTGRGPHQRDYRRAANLEFEKGLGARYIELKISDRASKQQPEFVIRNWE